MTEQDKKDIKEVLDLIASCLEAEEINYVPIPTDWITEHDKKVRADAIEEYKNKIKENCHVFGNCDFEDLDYIANELKEYKNG